MPISINTINNEAARLPINPRIPHTPAQLDLEAYDCFEESRPQSITLTYIPPAGGGAASVDTTSVMSLLGNSNVYVGSLHDAITVEALKAEGVTTIFHLVPDLDASISLNSDDLRAAEIQESLIIANEPLNIPSIRDQGKILVNFHKDVPLKVALEIANQMFN